jgi:large subunit ribosomal protein L7A
MENAMKKGKKVVGIKQSLKSLSNNNVLVAYIAQDADSRVTGSFEQECIRRNVEIVYFKTMKELGRECGIEIGTAAACIIKE